MNLSHDRVAAEIHLHGIGCDLNSLREITKRDARSVTPLLRDLKETMDALLELTLEVARQAPSTSPFPAFELWAAIFLECAFLGSGLDRAEFLACADGAWALDRLYDNWVAA
jgi:hypothetical protein